MGQVWSLVVHCAAARVISCATTVPRQSRESWVAKLVTRSVTTSRPIFFMAVSPGWIAASAEVAQAGIGARAEVRLRALEPEGKRPGLHGSLRRGQRRD